MDSSDSIDKSWDTTSDTTTTAQRSDPMASAEPPSSGPAGWMVNVTGRDIVEMSNADVLAKWKAGEIFGHSLVWREGMESWAKLDSVPAFRIHGKPRGAAQQEPSATEDANLVAVYERPMATLIFDEAVEAEWKPAPKVREPSKSTRGSASSRPPAPGLPPLGPPRPKSPSVPADVPPPPPPLPSRQPPRQSPIPARLSARPVATIPGGLEVPARAALASLSPASSPPPHAVSTGAPPLKRSSPPVTTSSSPLLAAIAAAASGPEPVVSALTAPEVAPVATPAPVILDEVSISARLYAMKSVSLRTAVVAAAGSALVASLLTGLIVGSRARPVARPVVEATAKPVAVAPTPPSPAPPPATPAPATEPVAAEKPAVPETPSAEKAAVAELAVAEKPKVTKPSKVSTWKPPPAPAGELAVADKPAPNPERDDPERAVPDHVDERSSAQPANWQANPGF